MPLPVHVLVHVPASSRDRSPSRPITTFHPFGSRWASIIIITMDSFTITLQVNSRAKNSDRVLLFTTPYQPASNQQATSVIDRYLSKVTCHNAVHAPNLIQNSDCFARQSADWLMYGNNGDFWPSPTLEACVDQAGSGTSPS